MCCVKYFNNFFILGFVSHSHDFNSHVFNFKGSLHLEALNSFLIFTERSEIYTKGGNSNNEV